MRYLAIDPGEKRIGLAVGDDVTRIARPLAVVAVANDDQRFDAIERAITDHEPEALLVGLPLNADGSQGPATEKSHRLAEQLTERFSLPVHLVDERWTSDNANETMSRSGLTHKGKKKRRDALAAATILDRFLNAT